MLTLISSKFGSFSFSKVNAKFSKGVDFWKFGVLKNERNEPKNAKKERKKAEKVAQKRLNCAFFGLSDSSFPARQRAKTARNSHFSLQNASEFWTFHFRNFKEILNTRNHSTKSRRGFVRSGHQPRFRTFRSNLLTFLSRQAENLDFFI